MFESLLVKISWMNCHANVVLSTTRKASKLWFATHLQHETENSHTQNAIIAATVILLISSVWLSNKFELADGRAVSNGAINAINTRLLRHQHAAETIKLNELGRLADGIVTSSPPPPSHILAANVANIEWWQENSRTLSILVFVRVRKT